MSTAFVNTLEKLKHAFHSQSNDSVDSTSSKATLEGQLFDWLPDCLSLHDETGRALFVSPSCVTVLGHKSDDLAGEKFLSRIHVQDRVSVLKTLSDCANGQKTRRVEFRLLSDFENKVEIVGDKWCEMVCRPVRADGKTIYQPMSDHPTRIVAITRDISERKTAEQKALRERENAESASIAKGRFLANISHELRTPLNAILGFSEMLKSDVADMFNEEKKREYAGHVHHSASHLLAVLNDILDMSKIDAGKYEILPEPFDLSEVLKATTGMLQGQAMAKGVSLRLEPVGEIPEICADKRAVKQVLINLVSNALKFTDEQGHVTVSAQRKGRRMEISVVDNGIGISAEHIKHLGEPFYQADSQYDRKYEGTGLGLSVVRGLVGLHSGNLTFKSKLGEGTTVIVDLPLLAKQAGPVPGEDHAEVIVLSKPIETDLKKQKNVLPSHTYHGTQEAEFKDEKKITG